MEQTVFITRDWPLTFNCNRSIPTKGGNIELIHLVQPKFITRYAKQLRQLKLMFLNQIINHQQILLDWRMIQTIYTPRSKQMNWYTEVQKVVSTDSTLTLCLQFHTYSNISATRTYE